MNNIIIIKINFQETTEDFEIENMPIHKPGIDFLCNYLIELASELNKIEGASIH